MAGLVEGAWPEAVLTIVGDYPSAWKAIESSPDLCITDLSMPGSEPLDGIAHMRSVAPDAPMVVVTGNEDDELLLALFELGISGFVTKTSQSAVIEAAIRVVLAGGTYVPERVLTLSSGRDGSVNLSGVATHARLTERQGDVLKLIAAGMSNKEVARELELSPATVKAHAAAAFAALGVNNRIEGVLKAKELDLI